MATTSPMYRREDLTSEQKDMISAAWFNYRESAVKIPPMSWPLYLEADSRLWSKYLEVERRALLMK